MSRKNKFIIWFLLIAIISFWMFVGVKEWFSGSIFAPQGAGLISALITLIIALLISLSLGLIFFRGKFESFILGGAAGLPFIAVFGISNLNLVGVAVLIFLVHFAEDIISSEIKERIKMNSRVLLRKCMSHFVIGILMLVAFAAYQSPAIDEFKNIQELPSATGEFIKNVVGNVFGAQLDNLGPTQKNTVIEQTSKEVHGEINVVLRPYMKYIPPALAFGIFLVLWGFAWFFIWLAVFIGMIVFYVLKRLNFFRIQEEDAKVEILTV